MAFDNDVDRAAYITALSKPDGKRSAKDADYLKFAMDATGMTEAEVRAHGQKVRDSIKGLAKDAEPGALKVPKVEYAKAAPSVSPAVPAVSPVDAGADVARTNDGKKAEGKSDLVGYMTANEEKMTDWDVFDIADQDDKSASDLAKKIILKRAKQKLKGRLSEGKQPLITISPSGEVSVNHGNDDRFDVPLDLTKDEKRAFKQAENDINLAETLEEKTAAKEAQQEAIKAAVDRAISGQDATAETNTTPKFRSKTIAQREKAVPPNRTAMEEFAASGKQAEFHLLLEMHRKDKTILTDEQFERFVNLREERNYALAAANNYAMGRIQKKPVAPVTQPATLGVPNAGAGATQPPQAAPEFVKVSMAQGGSVHVKKSDLDSDKTQLPMFTADGKRKGGTVHRENLDPTGEKLASLNAGTADNPLFDVITRKDGGAFATKMAAQRELNVRGMADTHEVVDATGGKGFVGKRKAAPTNVEAADTTAKPVDSAPKNGQFAESGKPLANKPTPRRPKGGSNLRKSAYQKNPLLTLLASKGLYHDKDKFGSLKSEFSPDKQIMVSGYGPVFKKSGLKLDALLDFAIQDGYLPQGASENDLYSLIQRAVSGEKITATLSEQGMSDMESEFAAALESRYEERPPMTDEEWYGQDEAGYADDLVNEVASLSDAELRRLDDIIEELWDTPPGNISTRASMEAMGFTEQEIQDEERRDAEKADEVAAREAGRGDGQGQTQEQAGESPGQEAQGLSSYTADEIRQRQEAQDKAEQGRAKQDREAEQRAQADAQRDDFTLTGSDRDTDVAAARGQGGLFDGPATGKEVRPWLIGQATAQADPEVASSAKTKPAGKTPAKIQDSGEVQTKETDKGVAMFSRSPATQQAYEARIDALFAGEKANRTGVTILDSSDVMGLLNFTKVPLVLNESHIANEGQTYHPEMTADVWKRVPEWIENPAAVYTDPKHPGKLTIVAPMRVAGYPVLIAVEPNSLRGKPDHLLVTAFAKTTGGLPPMGVLASSERLLYADTKKAPEIWSGIGDNPRPTRLITGATKILTEKNLAGYRKAQNPAMSRGQGTGMAKADAQDVVDAIKARWANAPEIVVASDMQDPDVPKAARLEDAKQRSQGASGEPEGFFYEGKVYIVASALQSPGAVVRVLFHEALGHYGLRGVFGKELLPILKQLVGLRRKEIIAKAREYGLVRNGPDGKPLVDVGSATDAQVWAAMDMDHKLTAAEEVLAEMAQSKPDMGFVKRAIAVIRAFLRKHVPGFQDMKLTDADIIANYILPARAFVERGPGGGAKGGVNFSRGNEQQQTKQLRELAKQARAGGNDNKTVALRLVSSKEADLLKDQGVDVDDSFTHTADMFAVRHALNRHGDAKTETKQGQLPIGEDDIAAIAQIVGAADALILGAKTPRGQDIVSSLKRLADGTVLYLEEVRSGRKTLAMTSMRKYPGTTDFETIKDRIVPSYAQSDTGDVRIVYPEGGSGQAPGNNPDIRFSRTMGATEMAGQVRDKLNETFNHPGKLSWWHKTVGSQYNLAERNPAFKKVFDSAQDFINDVSYYATEAANMAPKILPKLETLRDLTKSAISAADNKAVAAPVFEGTLSWARDADGKPIRIEALEKQYENLTDDQKARMLLRKNVVSEAQLKAWKASKIDVYSGAVRNRFESTFLKAGVRWTDAELKSIFKLTDEQVGLYKEFRAATDTSLDNMAKAQMLREAGKDVVDMRDMVMQAPDVDTAAQMLRETLLDMAKDDPDRADVLTDAAAGVLDTATKINDLKKQGYAPLSRFGRFTVDVVVDGKREYFGLFETEREANRMAAKMRMEFGADNVAQGTMSQKEFELFQGITPESLELFGNMMGLNSTGNEAQDKAFQTYLKLTKNNRSAMKRLIHRQGIAGYSEDVGRVLAAFVYANARQTSAALHIGQMDEAITAIPRGEGELKDHALELAKYIKEPQEEAAALRGWLFAQYLGGSVASAMVNFTQPLTISIPYLSQFGGLAKAGKAWAQAVKDISRGVELEDDLQRALKDAEESGVVSPQEVHQLMAQARGAATLQSGDGTRLGDAKAMAANGWTRTALAWGKLFGYAEQINRRSTFIAAYRMAVDQKIPNPGKFAEKAVNETQFVNNKANKMKFGRGAIGATLMTFKGYSIHWLELMHRLSTQDGKEGKLAAAYMLGALFLVAGAGGLPFAGDAEDLIDAIAQKMGYNFSAKKSKQEFLESVFGKAGAEFVDRGLTGLPGVPIDVSGRMGMSNLIPGTGLLLEKRDSTRDLMELAGPAGDMSKRFFEAVGLMAKGEVGDAVAKASPTAVGNMVKGMDMLDKGMYRDTKGAKVIDTTTGEALAKIAGFQPASVSPYGSKPLPVPECRPAPAPTP